MQVDDGLFQVVGAVVEEREHRSPDKFLAKRYKTFYARKLLMFVIS